MSWTNENVRDEIYEQDEDEDEGPPWVDDKGKILEAAFCEYFLTKHPLMCLKQTLFDLDGEVDEDKLIYEIIPRGMEAAARPHPPQKRHLLSG